MILDDLLKEMNGIGLFYWQWNNSYSKRIITNKLSKNVQIKLTICVSNYFFIVFCIYFFYIFYLS